MSQDLTPFDKLKADITLFVAPTLKIQVSDFKTSQGAIDAGKQVKEYISHVEGKRKEMVGPLNDQVKLINGYAKSIQEPLLHAEAHIKTQLQRFAIEQEKVQQEEIRKAEEARREAEKRAEEERQRIAEELAAKRQAELEALQADDQVASLFGCESDEPLEDRSAEIEQEAERARLEAEARFEREKLVRDAEFKEQTWDINQARIKNTKKAWKCEAVDLSLVPKEFLIIQLNSQAVLAAARGGVKEIPGVRIWQETQIALGSKTYVPMAALESEG